MSTATKNTPLPEWQKARMETADEVFKRILDPIMLFSELLTVYDEGCDSGRGVIFNTAEIGAAVRLLALGGMTDLLMGGRSRHVDGDSLKSVLRDWLEIDEECQTGGAS
jgi:hypothetical protein